jgi:hypothetical protein
LGKLQPRLAGDESSCLTASSFNHCLTKFAKAIEVIDTVQLKRATEGAKAEVDKSSIGVKMQIDCRSRRALRYYRHEVAMGHTKLNLYINLCAWMATH